MIYARSQLYSLLMPRRYVSAQAPSSIIGQFGTVSVAASGENGSCAYLGEAPVVGP